MKRVAIVAFPWGSRAPYSMIADVCRIVSQIVDSGIVITGGTERIGKVAENIRTIDIGVRMNYLNDLREERLPIMIWTYNLILAQLRQARQLILHREEFDTVLFYMAYPYHLVPLIIAKILRKKTIEVVTRGKRRGFVNRILSLQDSLFFNMLDGISPESSFIVDELDLTRYSEKLLPNGTRGVDVDHFNSIMEIDKRPALVGYVGRLVVDKGVLEFLASTPSIMKKRKEIDFIILGKGPLEKEIERRIEEYGSEAKKRIKIHNEVDHNEVPALLNKLRILVLPSRSEGLPTILLEAMSCGTIVLATRVGAVPEIVKEGETGFFLESAEPEHIGTRIMEILDDERLPQISIRAQSMIQEKFSLESVQRNWKKILDC